MSEKTALAITITCMIAVIVGFLLFLPMWMNMLFYAILGWMWAGRKVRKKEEQAEINKQEGIEK